MGEARGEPSISAKELSAAVSENPFRVPDADHSRLLVAFVQSPAALATLRAVEPLVAPCERFAIGAHVAYLYCPAGTLESKAWEALLGKARQLATTRNWKTVLKLQALAVALT